VWPAPPNVFETPALRHTQTSATGFVASVINNKHRVNCRLEGTYSDLPKKLRDCAPRYAVCPLVGVNFKTDLGKFRECGPWSAGLVGKLHVRRSASLQIIHARKTWYLTSKNYTGLFVNAFTNSVYLTALSADKYYCISCAT